MARLFLMQTIIALFLIAVSTWRVSYMFVFEDGPGEIFAKIRSAVGVLDLEDGSREIEFGLPFWKNFLAGIFSCIYCISISVGMFFSIFYAPNFMAWLVYAMFCSFSAIFIDLVHRKLSDG